MSDYSELLVMVGGAFVGWLIGWLIANVGMERKE